MLCYNFYFFIFLCSCIFLDYFRILILHEFGGKSFRITSFYPSSGFSYLMLIAFCVATVTTLTSFITELATDKAFTIHLKAFRFRTFTKECLIRRFLYKDDWIHFILKFLLLTKCLDTKSSGLSIFQVHSMSLFSGHCTFIN